MSIAATKKNLVTKSRKYSFIQSDEHAADFIVNNIFKRNKATVAYLIYFILIAIIFIFNFENKFYNLLSVRQYIIAIIGALITVMVPFHILHELLRAQIMSKLAKVQLHYRWNWRNLMLKVGYTNNLPTKANHLRLANMLPFVLCSVIPCGLALISGGTLSLFLLSLAFFHALYSIKGFSLLSYLYRSKQLV